MKRNTVSVIFHDTAMLKPQTSPTARDLNLRASWVAGSPDRSL